MHEEPQFLRNEFAMVELTVKGDRGAQRLRIRNAETDDVVELDPLELEALTRMDHRDFGRLIVNDTMGPEPLGPEPLGS
ncbi:MAG TPA: dihydrodiol dehydrogenase [Coriobacteriia bacterium]|nr:dihydrodiol dehydrogenase [Coriobacteriia bacterium]